ncbi:MAG: Gfo/Idh/MocA family oxidoreductase [Thaumarchaeota archaeon]|nr:Gfo/Idh/MocA family oxidoreductase [Nitrososphaerota archaeon]MCL5317484.1 Gfo/Idh/MocA family oxidoreductase [Nitrososphaerota archaeon]
MTEEKRVKPVNVGVIGAGYWGRKVIQEYLNLSQINKDIKLLAVSDVSPKSLALYKDKVHIPFLYSDFQELLEHPDIDAVHICTPNETHYNIGMNALKAGKHVLMEKPIAVTSQQASELVSFARSTERILGVGHIYRFNNAIDEARRIVQSRKLGRLFHVRLQWTTYESLMLGRDIIFDLGPHPIDIMNKLLDDWPETVNCNAISCRQTNEEVAYISCEFKDGLSSQVEMSWLLPGKVRELSIIGSEGSLKIDCLNQKMELYNGNHHTLTLEAAANNTILSEITHFVQNVSKVRDEKAQVTLQNGGVLGARVVDVLAAAKESRRNKRAVHVNYNRYD